MRQATIGARAPVSSIRFLCGVASVALLAGCQSGPLANLGSDATRAVPVADSIQLIERDIEAPEVFHAQDRALWDGRPSLGGVWVAAPNVRDPERVIIRNEENGKFVIGALFKRERDNPGPALQLSSDAAAALGIIAGAPTSIDVVALRREEVVEEPTAAPDATAPSPVADVDAAAEPLAEDIVQADPLDTTTDPVDTTELIEAANAALNAPSGVTIEPAPGGAATGEADLITEAGAELADAPLTEPEARPRRNFFQRIFGRDRNQMPEAELPETAAGLDAPIETLPNDTPVAETAATPVIEATSLDAPETQVASLAPERPRAGTLDRAYVQIGIFSVEENARNTATALSQSGVLPTVLEQESRGRTFWRVVVGPSTTASDRAAILRKARELGFADAYAVRG